MTTKRRISAVRFMARFMGGIYISAVAKGAKHRQVLRIQRVDDDRPGPSRARRFLRFDQDRQVGKSRVVQEPPERFHTQASTTDVLVPVDAAGAEIGRASCRGRVDGA